jgi:imidazolonepropionase-like amidohydrolase
LRAATAVPAGRMKQQAGRIAPGLRADMVLLRANPLDDIANTRSIEGVIVNGRYFDRSRLDTILARVDEANAASRTVDL